LTIARNRRPLPERVLSGILIALLAIIALVTVWVLLIRPHNSALVTEAPVSDAAPSEILIFAGIGRLRARLAPSARGKPVDDGSTAVIAVGFPYDSSDRPFLEELSFNVDKFRSVTIDYFASIPADSPLLNDEPALKDALLSRYNALLRLGKIETLYFSEFIIID
jgi:flagellar basal body-associated protein FliL